MKHQALIIAGIALLLSAAIYVLYRSEQTFINVLLTQWLPGSLLPSIRHLAAQWLPLPDEITWRLPGGLWVFASSWIAREFPPLPGFPRASLDWTPTASAIGLEVLQYFHVTDGAFDPWDIAVAVAAWGVMCVTSGRADQEADPHGGRWNWLLYVACFAILVFADVRP